MCIDHIHKENTAHGSGQNKMKKMRWRIEQEINPFKDTFGTLVVI